MTSNKLRQDSGKSQAYIPSGLPDPDVPQEAPVNGSGTDTPVLVELAQTSQDKYPITIIPGRLMQETMSVWRIDIPTGQCSRPDPTGGWRLDKNITELYTEGYKLFGIYGVSGNVGWAYLSNWVEVE